MSDSGAELIQTVKQNFNARKTWKKAFKTVAALNALKRGSTGIESPTEEGEGKKGGREMEISEEVLEKIREEERLKGNVDGQGS